MNTQFLPSPARTLHRGGYAGRVLRRLSASPWFRAGLLAIALGFACYGLVSQWPQVRAALGQLAAYDVIGAALAVIAALGCMMLAWRALLTDLGSPLPVTAAIRVMFLGQLGKYVPGAVWAIAAQVSLAQDYRVPKKRSGAASLVSMAIGLVVGLVMAGITLPLASAGSLRHYWWVLLCIPVILVGLYPPVTTFGLNLALRIIRRPPLDTSLSVGGMGRAAGWTALGWACYGLHAWLLIGDIAGKSLHILLLSAGGYALAWAVGFLLIPFPGGIGPREVALIAVLSPVMPQGPALVIALASRVVMTVGDLAWAGLAVAIGRREVRAPAAAPAVTAAPVAETVPSGPSAPSREGAPVQGTPGREIPGQEAPAPAGRPGSAEPAGSRPSSRPDQPPGRPNATGPTPPAR
jgi:glycosyltransferase 2 family protein